MNDHILNLAMSIYSNPGVYALLLGSGISKPAAIPTGWEIVSDLISKLQALSQDTNETDLANWFKHKYGEEPEYSKILEMIGPTQTERNAILRSYFEPNEDEQEQKVKVPTAAHQAIASLVKNGYIKMIVTTNFDRLLELALQEQGIVPIVISTDDAISGAMPFVHSNCTILKVHGDYRDTRIKNTKEELGTYSTTLNTYLDRVFDEFGLIVCGWSGQWDVALTKAIIRCQSRRFTTYWTSRRIPKDDVQRLIDHRKARLIEIETADKFFTNLSDKVESLKQMEPFSPVSTPIAIATTKRFLAEEKYRIRLHDFIVEEVEKCHFELASQRFNLPNKIEKPIYQARMLDYQNVANIVLAILTTVSYFGTESVSYLLTSQINRLAEIDKRGGITALIELQRYPALLISYACGIVALAAERWENLAAILLKTSITHDNKIIPAIKVLNVTNVFCDGTHKWVLHPNAEKELTPANEYIQTLVRDMLRPYISSDTRYQELFDIYEYLLALVYLDICLKPSSSIRAPLGCFSWRYRHSLEDRVSTPIDEFLSQGIILGEDWGLLKAGFFGGSSEKLGILLRNLNRYVEQVRRNWW